MIAQHDLVAAFEHVAGGDGDVILRGRTRLRVSQTRSGPLGW